MQEDHERPSTSFSKTQHNGTGGDERVLNRRETRDYDRGHSGGVTVEQMTVQAWSDRFDLKQVERELAMQGAL
jgi:hypothetical protein